MAGSSWFPDVDGVVLGCLGCLVLGRHVTARGIAGHEVVFGERTGVLRVRSGVVAPGRQLVRFLPGHLLLERLVDPLLGFGGAIVLGTERALRWVVADDAIVVELFSLVLFVSGHVRSLPEHGATKRVAVATRRIGSGRDGSGPDGTLRSGADAARVALFDGK